MGKLSLRKSYTSHERQAVEMAKSVEEMVAEQIYRSQLARKERIEEGHAVTNPVITISRSMGSGGRIVARKLAEDLGFSLWDRELIDAIALESEMPSEVVEAFDEKAVSEIELLIRGALGDYESAGFLYPRHLARTVAMIASVGNAIILGRGANYLLRDALNVRMDASIEKRIENMLEYEDIDRRAAERKLRQSDKEREQFLEKVFGREKMSGSHIDLCLWMDNFSPADAAKIIEAAFHVRFKR
jgi:cytidylate kinase